MCCKVAVQAALLQCATSNLAITARRQGATGTGDQGGMLAGFLRGRRSSVVRQIKDGIGISDVRLNFVLGNESCDHDSAISTLVYAWFCSTVHGNHDQVHHIPVLNTNEDLFRLKTETVHFLEKHGVDRKDLIFRDTLDFEGLCAQKPSNVKVTLVDHHVLSSRDECFSPYIKEIIDHRTQLKTFDDREIAVEIAPVGSCMTMIAERVLRAIDSAKLVVTHSEMKELSLLMSGPILLDTVNLAESAGKVTPRDREIISKLWKDEHDPDISNLFKELSEAKFFVEGLSCKDLILKDLKTIESRDSHFKVVFSTMHASLNKFFDDTSSKQSIRMFMEEKKAQLWVALFPVEKDSTGRNFKPVIIYSELPDIRTQIHQALNDSEVPSLNLEAIESSIYGKNLLYLRMFNTKASRKQILPIVQAFIT